MLFAGVLFAGVLFAGVLFAGVLFAVIADHQQRACHEKAIG